MKKACNFIKKETLVHRCFAVNFVKFLTKSFSHKTSGRLFLKIEITTVLIAGFNPGQTWVLFSYGFSKKQDCGTAIFKIKVTYLWINRLLGKCLHKGEFYLQKLMNIKIQNTYQIVKVLETNIFGYIFE